MHGQPAPTTNQLVMIDCTKLEIIDEKSLESKHVLPHDQPFKLYIDFALSGSWSDWVTTLAGVQYTIEYYADQRGGPFDARIAIIGPKNLVAHQAAYTQADTEVTIPANTLQRGLYEVSAVVTFNGNPDMTGFNELALIEIT